jgi:hypothetical protein
LTGVLYRERASSEEDILTSLRIIGIIYRDIAPPSRATRRATEVEEPSGNGFRKAERILLYLLPIIGVLGLVVPIALKQFNITLLSSYIAVALIVLPVVYLLYLRYHSTARSTTDSS